MSCKRKCLMANTYSIQVKEPKIYENMETPRHCFATEVRKGLVKQPLSQRRVNLLTLWERSKNTSGWNANVLV